MNKTNLIIKISEISGVDTHNCKKVLDAFEKALDNELSNLGCAEKAFDKIYKMMSFIRKGRDLKN